MNITRNTESSSIVVQWDEVDDSLPTTYIVTWASENNLNNVQAKTVIEQSSYTITGLTFNTVYTITVTAINRCGSGPEYSTIVSLSTDSTSSSTSTITAITNTMAITSATSSSTITAIAKSSTITITASIAVMSPSTSTTNPITISGITSTYTATDIIMSPVSTADTTTADEDSMILSIS